VRGSGAHLTIGGGWRCARPRRVRALEEQTRRPRRAFYSPPRF
jgi:hypothetical protein